MKLRIVKREDKCYIVQRLYLWIFWVTYEEEDCMDFGYISTSPRVFKDGSSAMTFLREEAKKVKEESYPQVIGVFNYE